MKRVCNTFLLALSLLLCPGLASADEIRVAVASNFTDVSKDIAQSFEKNTGHQVILAFSSTGKHYAQIKHGAPFEAFFAADVKRPKLLEDEGIAQPGSRFTYAIGKIALWSPDAELVDSKAAVLKDGGFRYLSIANPKLAPYGRAAAQVMNDQGVWEALQGRLVRGENIGQTFQFVKSGNAQLGFVALSQIKKPGAAMEGSYWLPPQSLYDPIAQQAVLLKDNAVARQFIDFVKNDEQALEIIRAYGYGVDHAD